MIKYNADTNEIHVIETFSWDTVKHLIECAKKHYANLYENDKLSQEDAEKIEKFLNWDPETYPETDEETLCFGNTKTDIMQYLAKEMTNDEWNDFFNAEYSIQNALAELLTSEFGVDMEACEIFPDINVNYC